MRLSILPGLLLAVAATPAFAEPAHNHLPLDVHADGSVTVEGVTYASMADWHRSDEFKASGARCGTPEPSWEQIELAKASPTHCSFSQTSIQDEYDPGDVIEIPVVFHVIESSTGAGHLSDELITSQVDILNEDFEALTGTPGGQGTAGAIRFVLATVDENGDDTNGINRVVNNTYFTNPESAKSALNWNPSLYFNLYSLDLGGGLLGYASFPMNEAGASSDGVVIGYHFIGRDAPQGGQYDQGRTATHEVGHYLGLFHTFQSGCGTGYTAGDLIADTQAESAEHYGCPTSASSGCGGGTAPIRNYMNYTDDTCMTHFTPEQVNRMRCAITNYREGFGNLWPVADFAYTTEDGFTFDFSDLSTDSDGEVVLREWVFGDGESQLGGTEVSHTFEPGTYEVALVIMDSSGARRRKAVTIVADPPPTAQFSAEPDGGLNIQFHDESSDSNGDVVAWAWDFGDGSTSDEQDPSHEYAEAGVYTVSLTVTDEAGATATVTHDIMVSEDTGGCCDAGSGASGLATFMTGAFGFALLFGRRRRRAKA